MIMKSRRGQSESATVQGNLQVLLKYFKVQHDVKRTEPYYWYTRNREFAREVNHFGSISWSNIWEYFSLNQQTLNQSSLFKRERNSVKRGLWNSWWEFGSLILSPFMRCKAFLGKLFFQSRMVTKTSFPCLRNNQKLVKTLKPLKAFVKKRHRMTYKPEMEFSHLRRTD